MTWQGATVSGSVTRRRKLYLCGGIIGNLKKKGLGRVEGYTYELGKPAARPIGSRIRAE